MWKNERRCLQFLELKNHNFWFHFFMFWWKKWTQWQNKSPASLFNVSRAARRFRRSQCPTSSPHRGRSSWGVHPRCVLVVFCHAQLILNTPPLGAFCLFHFFANSDDSSRINTTWYRPQRSVVGTTAAVSQRLRRGTCSPQSISLRRSCGVCMDKLERT